MTKLIEIPFNASLIGQEGITVKYRCKEQPYEVLYDSSWPCILSITDGPEAYRHFKNGMMRDDMKETNYDLLLYSEQKVMSVDEWKYTKRHSAYMHNGWLLGVEDLAAAIKNGEVEI
jgi:hypothetical protein